MEENEKMSNREEIFSKAVRAGKRTYFFDVKSTKGDEKYITITESKRRFSNDQDRFFYEKHKIFLYKEDFEKFSNALKGALEFIETDELLEVTPQNLRIRKKILDSTMRKRAQRK